MTRVEKDKCRVCRGQKVVTDKKVIEVCAVMCMYICTVILENVVSKYFKFRT